MRATLLALLFVGATAAPLQPEDCPSYTATPDSTVDSAWCDSMCKAGNCPPTLCQCAGAAADAEGQAAPGAAAANGATDAARTKIEEVVKVDMSGEKNLPFDKAIIGYYGAGPYADSLLEQ